MEQLPLTFVQSTVEPQIQGFFRPAYNFSRINSSNGRLAFTADKVYWLPDAPMALLDQGWVISASEVDSCSKQGIAGFIIKLKDGKELRFSNVDAKMREGITAAIDARKDAPAAAESPAPEAGAAPEAEAPAAEAPVNDAAAPAAAPAIDPSDANANKVMAILAYLGILVFIPLFAAKESKFARFHTNQGLILFICSVVIFVVGRIPGLATLAWLLNIAVAVFAIIGIINAAKGEAKELPLIGKFRIISQE